MEETKAEDIFSEIASAVSSATKSITGDAGSQETSPAVAVESEEEDQVAQVAAPKVKKTRAIRPPKDANTFFRARAKNPKLYGFTPDGNMEVRSLTGDVVNTLELPSYRNTTPAERADYDLGILDEIRKVEKEYDETMRLLKQALAAWKETGLSSEALEYQRSLIALDAKRTDLRSPLRWTRMSKNPAKKVMFLHSRQPDTKVGYPVYSLTLQRYPFKQLVKEGKESKDVGLPSVPEQASEVFVEKFVVFSKPTEQDYGVLSPETPMDITFNTTRYTSILQAFHAERLGQLGNQPLRTSILKSTNPKTIRFMGESVKTPTENPSPRELIISIAKEATKQDARLIPILRKTGLESIVYADAKDTMLGVGVSPDNLDQITDRDSWKGKNLLGQAWESIRSELPKEDESVQSGGAVLEKARTLTDVKKERSKVLMGMYRRKF